MAFRDTRGSPDSIPFEMQCRQRWWHNTVKNRHPRHRRSPSSHWSRKRSGAKAKSKSLRRRLPVHFEHLEPRQMLAAQFLITEFMASNTNTLLDEDGDTSDWLELYNAGDEVGSLEGYHLTDNATVLDKWTVPNVELQPREYLLVWASGKDLRDPHLRIAHEFQARRRRRIPGTRGTGWSNGRIVF